jgi:hypothetical protein
MSMRNAKGGKPSSILDSPQNQESTHVDFWLRLKESFKKNSLIAIYIFDQQAHHLFDGGEVY